jgi:predicted peptidase
MRTAFKVGNMKRNSARFFTLLSIGLILFTAAPALCAHLTWAQYNAVFKALRYPAAGGTDVLMYRLCMPYHYDSTARYPLIICLHGVGERGADDSIQVKNNCLATVWADSTVQNRFPHFIVAPQCPTAYQWTQTSWNQTVVNYDGIPLSIPLTMAMKLIDSLVRIYRSIDTNRLYIVGLSMGGWGTWDAITRYPGKFAAAIPICGGGDTSKATRLVNMALWVGVGSLDPTIPPQASRNLVNAIERRGKTWLKSLTNIAWTSGSPTRAQFIPQVLTNPKPQFIFSEYTDGYHDVWTNLLNDTLVFPWIFSKSKGGTAVKDRSAALAAGQKRPLTRTMVRFCGKKPVAGEAAGSATRIYSLSGRQRGKIDRKEENNVSGTEVLILQDK